MTTQNNEDKELREAIEDLIVDTSLHPVDASLRIMQLVSKETEKRVREAQLQSLLHAYSLMEAEYEAYPINIGKFISHAKRETWNALKEHQALTNDKEAAA